jgi:hypothetical protein
MQPTAEIDTALSRRGVMHGLGSCRLTWKGGMFDGVAGGCWVEGRGGMKGNAYDACTLRAPWRLIFGVCARIVWLVVD